MKYIIVGLGNIGIKYEGTRHNIGFEIVGKFADKHKVNFKNEKYALITSFRYRSVPCYLVKPTLYMNNSGKSVNYWLQFLNIPLDRLLIIGDDIGLPFGKIRLKIKGGHGGHNGLRDIENKLGTFKYARLRFGIGHNFDKFRQVNYVLGCFQEEEQKKLPLLIENVHDIIEFFIVNGALKTMNKFN